MASLVARKKDDSIMDGVMSVPLEMLFFVLLVQIGVFQVELRLQFHDTEYLVVLQVSNVSPSSRGAIPAVHCLSSACTPASG